MRSRLGSLLRSMPFRLALGLVALFSVVSLLSFAASYVVSARSLDRNMRADLLQDMAGFRAAPNAAALAALVAAEARGTDPDRMVLTYLAPNGRSYGNTMITRDTDGYHLVSLAQGNPRIKGDYFALTDTLWGGQLTVARNRGEIAALRQVFFNILGLSLIPTLIIALSGGLYFARHSARQVDEIATTLDQLTSGDLAARIKPGRGWTADLAQIGEKVDEMARAQETTVAAIKQVSSDIAHDLKTPIQRVAVYLDELSRTNKLEPDSQVLLGKVTQEVNDIASIFRSLLQIAQIESGSPRARFRDVDLVALCRTFLDIYEPTASDNAQTLVFIPPATESVLVRGDKTLLGQVLANLIENALRHTDKGAAIEIAVAEIGGRVTLSVSDNGPGILEAERDLVLRRLYRLDRSRTLPGNGLGLSLVSSIAVLHDADLELTDNDPGLRVTLRFPAQHRKAQSHRF